MPNSQNSNDLSKKQTDFNTILAIEEAIKSTIGAIESLTTELSRQKEMLGDSLSNERMLSEEDAKCKAATRKKKEVKAQVMKLPSILILSEKVKEVMAELKEKRTALSDYLREYNRLTGATQIEVDGEIREIVLAARLVKKKEKK